MTVSLNGEYRFYQNGKLIHTQKNLLTTEGKRLILRYLTGQAGSIGEAIGLGVGETAATVDDVRLAFEVYRTNVTLRNADFASGVIIFKSTIPQEQVFKIYEAGLWSTSTNSVNTEGASRVLTVFDLDIEDWTNVTVDATIARTSVDAVKVDAAASTTTKARAQSAMELDTFSPNDILLLAFQKTSADIISLALTFESDAGGSLSLEKSITALPVGYNVLAFRKGDFVATGSVAWNSITNYGVDVKAGATGGNVILDSIRIEDTDTINPDYALVSRTVMAAPLVKTSIAPMDVEYALEIDFA